MLAILALLLVACGGTEDEAGNESETKSTTINAPTNLQATAGSDEITLSWSTPTNADYLEIYRDTDSNGNQRDKLASPLVAAGNTYKDTGLSVGSTYYYWLKACQTGGQCSDFSTIASAQTGATPLFQENYESYSTGYLPDDYVIVYNGSGNSQQYVTEDNGNKYLRTSGRSYWALHIRKDFDTDLPSKVEVSWRMQSAEDPSSYVYEWTGSPFGNYAIGANFSIKNESEKVAGISYYTFLDNRKSYLVCSDSEKVQENGRWSDGSFERIEVDPQNWMDLRLIIDFANKTYTAYVDGQAMCENFTLGEVDLSSDTHWGEKTGIRFGSGNSHTTISYFDDIVIKEVEDQEIDLKNGLVAEYLFNGNANDTSGNENHGTVHGSVVYLDRTNGKALSLLNSYHAIKDQYVSLNLSNAFSDNFSHSFFFKFKNLSSSHSETIFSCGIQSSGNFWGAWLSADGDITALSVENNSGSIGGSFTPIIKLPSNLFVHIAFIKQNNKFSVYRNGDLISSTNLKTGDYPTANGCYIGSHDWVYNGGSESSRINGDFYDYKIYNRALSDAEVRSLYLANE